MRHAENAKLYLLEEAVGKMVCSGGRAFAKLSGVEISDDIKPIELGVLLHQEIEKTEPKDEQEKYLFSMLKDYKPTDEYDEQMKELLLWGKGEQYLWTVTIL